MILNLLFAKECQNSPCYKISNTQCTFIIIYYINNCDDD